MSETDAGKNQPKLHEVPPREIAGRDSSSRDQAQFRAAAHECLQLLEDSDLDRVYSDFQDDFVARLKAHGGHSYKFYQVKTQGKRNHQWSTNELFGLEKRRKAANPQKIAESFVGKMIIHTINFKQACTRVTFLTNVHLQDEVEKCLAAMISGDKNNRYYNLLIENFNGAFSPIPLLEEEGIIELLKKVNLVPNVSYLSPDDEAFSAIARKTVFEYSEIDLRHQECEEIINNLIALVGRKSFRKLMGTITEQELDDKAGIGLSEMLDILSISKGAYQQLKAGGDPHAIKNASIIQRLLNQAGASARSIEYASECKVKWDIWFRDKRHVIPEFDLNFMLEEIEVKARLWAKQLLPIGHLEIVVDALFNSFKTRQLTDTLEKPHILGAIFSTIVRIESQ